LADRSVFTGAAGAQIQAVVAAVGELVARYPAAAAYAPAPNLVTCGRSGSPRSPLTPPVP